MPGSREVKLQYLRDYYARNRKRLSRLRKKTYLENPEKYRAKARRYYENNREKVLAERKEQRKLPYIKEQQKKYSKKYYENNREEVCRRRRLAYVRQKASRERVKALADMWEISPGQVQEKIRAKKQRQYLSLRNKLPCWYGKER